MTYEEANKAIKDAWITGLVAIGVAITLTLVYASGAGFAHVDWWNWLDIVLLAGLTFGISRQNKWAAVTMLVYFVASKLYFWIDETALIGLPIAGIFAYFFWRGVKGTFALKD